MINLNSCQLISCWSYQLIVSALKWRRQFKAKYLNNKKQTQTTIAWLFLFQRVHGKTYFVFDRTKPWVQKDKWHDNMSYLPLSFWRTALNFLVAQTPRCELWKRRGLCRRCLSHEDKTCSFRTLLVLWKGHRLVRNIKQLMLSEIKRVLEESGKLQNGFDGIYRSISNRYDGIEK